MLVFVKEAGKAEAGDSISTPTLSSYKGEPTATSAVIVLEEEVKAMSKPAVAFLRFGFLVLF